MEAIYKFMENTASIIIFMVAFTLFMLNNGQLIDYLSSTKAEMLQVQTVKVDKIDSNDVNTVSYEQLIGQLVIGPSTDMQIDGMLIDSETFVLEDFNLNLIRNNNYEKSLIKNTKGEIIKIVYVSK